VNQFLASRIETAHSSKLVGAFVKAIFVIDAADDVAGRMIRAARDHVLHANSTVVDRVDLATPLSLTSQPATGPSTLAPAQRAGGVLGMLSSLEVKVLYPT
jgi:hypothetical protein